MREIYETKRTIDEVLDLETGQIINAKEFFYQPESAISHYRRELQEAILGMRPPKFVCPYCSQLLKLSGKCTQRGVVSFFAHLHDSEDCEIKTDNHLTKEEIEALKFGSIRESVRHKELKMQIYTALEDDRSREVGIENVEIEKRITSQVPYFNWRQPDISAEYKGKKMVFELQLSTTFLSVIVERDIFYRMNNIFIVWIFNFSDNQEFINLGNLMCKDIYYSNKRNAFIFDKKAMILTKERKQLILNCIWFEPLIENGKIDLSKSIKKSEYISIEDLQFDESNYKPFYVDADQLFEKYAPATYKKRELDESFILENFRQLQKKAEKKELETRKTETILYSIREKLKAGETQLKLFEKNGKWGYMADEVVVVTPNYSEATEFNVSGYAKVKKNKKYGFINNAGDLVIPCDYIEAFDISNNKCIVRDKNGWHCLDISNNTLTFLGCTDIVPFDDSDKFLKIKYEAKTKEYAGVNRGGYNIYVNNSSWNYALLTHDGEIYFNNCLDISFIAKKVFIVKTNPGEIYFYSNTLQKIFPYAFSEIKTSYNNDMTFVVKKDNYYGYINIDGEVLIPFEYDEIGDFIYGITKARKNENWGIINEEGGVLAAFKYTFISDFKEGIAIIIDSIQGNVGVIDLSGNTVIPFEYNCSAIKINSEGKIKAKKNSKWGYFDKTGNIIIPFEFDSIGDLVSDGVINAKKDGVWGTFDKEGHIILPFQYFSMSDFIHGIAKASDSIQGQYGIIDLSGKTIIPFEFESIDIQISPDGKVIAKKYCRWACFDNTGKIIVPFEFGASEIEIYPDGKIKAKKDSRWGYFDKTGEIIVPFEFDFIGQFTDGKAEAQKYGKRGTINSSGIEIVDKVIKIDGSILKASKFEKWGIESITGDVLFPYELDSIGEFINGKAFARKGCGCGVIDKRGNIIIPFEYTTIDEFINGKAKAIKNNKCGKIDEFGNEIIDNAIEIYEGVIKGQAFGKWGLKSTDGRIILPFEYSVIEEFINGNAIVQKNNNWGVIDKNGNIIISLEYSEIRKFFFIEGKFKAKRSWKWGVLDEKGNVIIPFEYYEIDELFDDKFKVQASSAWGVFDEKGNIIIPFEYSQIFELFCVNGKAKAQKEQRWGIINENGDIIIPFEYNDIEDLYDGMIKVQKGINWGVIDENGNIIIPFEYDEIEEFIDGKIKARKNNLWGKIDELGNKLICDAIEIDKGIIKGHIFGKWGLKSIDGRIILPFEYSEIEEFIDGRAKVQKDSKFGLVDMNGTTLIPFEYDNILAFYNGGVLVLKDKCLSIVPLNVRAQKLSLPITSITDFGIFLRFDCFLEGLLHISSIKRAGKDISDFKKAYGCVDVYIDSVNTERQRVSFSLLPPLKGVSNKEKEKLKVDSLNIGDSFEGVISSIADFGLFVRLEEKFTALLHISEIKKNRHSIEEYNHGDKITVNVLAIDVKRNRVSLTY